MATLFKVVINILSWIFAITFGLESFVLLSLICQLTLLILAPCRKRSRWLVFLVWNVYLFEAGLGVYVIGSVPIYHFKPGTGDLGVYWAAYTLLHLGGPNTITGLTCSDNELWLRYATSFFTLCYGFGVVCHKRSFQDNILLWPTICIFIAAVVRAIEKVMCRFSARFTEFQESTLPESDPGVNYVELLNTHCSFQASKIPVVFEISSPVQGYDDGVITEAAGSTAPESNNELTQVQIVKQAYRFFQDFQGLFVNSICSYDTRDKSRPFFLHRKNAEEAFRICEVELNFAFDVFYTKSILFHHYNWGALLLNLTPVLLQLASLVLWIRLVHKDNFSIRSSVRGTNFLVCGNIAFEFLSLLLFITSDWCIAKASKQKAIGKFLLFFYEKLLNKPTRTIPCIFGFPRFLLSRWSQEIPQLNLLRTSVFNIPSKLDLRYKKFTNELREFIFEELVIRSQSAQHPEDVEELCSTRGTWILTLLSRKYEDKGLKADAFKPWITEVEFEASVTLWHIATTICYLLDEEAHPPERGINSVDHRKLSKIIADYLMNLLIKQPGLMLPSARIHAPVIYNDTCADVRRFVLRFFPDKTPQLPKWLIRSKKEEEERLRKACRKMDQVDTKVIPPRRIMGNESKSLLFDAFLLAKELRALSEKQINKWEIINRVLAEMLFYSAVHSTSNKHVERLIYGGELLTVVWFLMANLGLGTRFRQKMGTNRRAQLVLTKHC